MKQRLHEKKKSLLKEGIERLKDLQCFYRNKVLSHKTYKLLEWELNELKCELRFGNKHTVEKVVKDNDARYKKRMKQVEPKKEIEDSPTKNSAELERMLITYFRN